MMRRLNRVRRTSALRNLIAQTRLSPDNLVMPYFVREGRKIRQPVSAMPGVFRFSQDELLKEVEQLRRSGVRSAILFGVPGDKDDSGASAYSENGLIQKAVRALKKNFGDELAVITDVCLCGYTKHGHCGILKTVDSLSFMVDSKQKEKGRKLSTINYQPKIDNDETLKVLSKIALSHARAGADIVAPSAMMDGQVAAIREGLDKNGFGDTAIMGYSAKFASNFYGPFREAAGSGMKFGARKSYQMDFRNSEKPLREIEADIQEGADMVMVKPALVYLDIIAKAKDKFTVPLAAFNVSGEYAMVKAYCERLEVACLLASRRSPRGEAVGSRGPARQGGLKLGGEKDIVLEILTAIRRAGADIIITYYAKEAAGWLKKT